MWKQGQELGFEVWSAVAQEDPKKKNTYEKSYKLCVKKMRLVVRETIMAPMNAHLIDGKTLATKQLTATYHLPKSSTELDTILNM